MIVLRFREARAFFACIIALNKTAADWCSVFAPQAGGVGVVFRAMQRLVGEAVVQVKGADMLQTLITEEPQV